jgi:hypothetical protein
LGQHSVGTWVKNASAVTRKLNHLVDLAYLKGGQAEKLRNLMKAVQQ